MLATTHRRVGFKRSVTDSTGKICEVGSKFKFTKFNALFGVPTYYLNLIAVIEDIDRDGTIIFSFLCEPLRYRKINAQIFLTHAEKY